MSPCSSLFGSIIMNDLQRYQFDLQGYVVVRGALGQKEVERLNSVLDERLTADAYVTHPPYQNRFLDFLLWDPGFRALLDHPSIVPVLEELLGDRFRVDHYYGFDYAAQEIPLGLHGGGDDYHGIAFYRFQGNRMFSGHAACVWALTDHPEGQGFLCIPGSHKANLPFPEDVGQRAPELLQAIPMQAGDVLVFTEALTHATAPWTAPWRRRVLFYKYCPRYIAWGGRRVEEDGVGSTYSDWDPQLVELCTERQRELLAPPYDWPEVREPAIAARSHSSHS